MEPTKKQHRGHCQDCLREHAVLSSTGLMAKHGYQLQDAPWRDGSKFFSGICDGQNGKPLEQDCERAEAIISKMQEMVDDAAHTLEGIKNQDVDILSKTYVLVSRERKKVTLPYLEVTKDEAHAFKFRQERFIRQMESNIQTYQEAIRLFHGKPLIDAKRILSLHLEKVERIQQKEQERKQAITDKKTAQQVFAGDRVFHQKLGVLTAQNTSQKDVSVDFFNRKNGHIESMEKHHWVRLRDKQDNPALVLRPILNEPVTESELVKPVTVGDVLCDSDAGPLEVLRFPDDCYAVCLDQYRVKRFIHKEWLNILRYIEENPDAENKEDNPVLLERIEKTQPKPKRRREPHDIEEGDLLIEFQLGGRIMRAVQVVEEINQVIVDYVGKDSQLNLDKTSPSRLYSWDIDWWMNERKNMRDEDRVLAENLQNQLMKSDGEPDESTVFVGNDEPDESVDLIQRCSDGHSMDAF